MTNINLKNTSITCLEDKTFKNCSSLSSIVLPKFLKTISKSCFFNCKELHTLKIPKTVTTIDDSFHNCNSLSIIIDNNNTIIRLNHEIFSNPEIHIMVPSNMLDKYIKYY